ncbi:MAG: hypothetical protein ACYDCL_11945 [Myxococcales bacterium]
MTEASIPVDVRNPGQVFACLGFLEAADGIAGEAQGGFDWRGGGSVHFCLRSAGDENPFKRVLKFLAAAALAELVCLDVFPAKAGDPNTHPIVLCDGQDSLELGHWSDGSSREPFKLYSGNRSAAGIASTMVRDVGTLWRADPEALAEKPFDVLSPMAGTFNFDPRKSWTAIDAGYSPDKQDHAIPASPVVEILAALAMEHARPDEFDVRRVRYAVWSDLLSPALARPAFAGVDIGIPLRTFRFTLALAGKNKVVTFAQEESSK